MMTIRPNNRSNINNNTNTGRRLGMEAVGSTVINITIKPPDGGPLAIVATLVGTKGGGLHAAALKVILFEALSAYLDTAAPHLDSDSTTEAGTEADGHRDGIVPVVLALETTAVLDTDAGAPLSSTTVIPLVSSAAVCNSVRSIVNRGRDYWAFECRGEFVQDHGSINLDTDQPAHDVSLVPLHTIPPPPFFVSSIGIR
jgi:hypothetical protein